MEFISFDEIITSRKIPRRGKRTVNNGLVSVTQVFYYQRETPSRVTTIRISEEAMDRARLKMGDRVELAFSKDGKYWRIKSIDDQSKGYKISGNQKTAKIGVIRGTWYEGMPLIGNDIEIAKAKMYSIDATIKIQIGEVIVEFKEPEIDERVKNTLEEEAL
jgi:hypothetical protein